MENFFLTLLIGIVAGTVDVLPMIKMKLDKYATLSAFTFYLIMPFIIFNMNVLQEIWWIKGGIITFLLAIPIMILASQENNKNMIPIGLMAFILGTIIGIVGHYLGI